MGQTAQHWTLARLYDGKYSVRLGEREVYLLDPQRRVGKSLTESDPITPQQAVAIERMLNSIELDGEVRRAENAAAAA